jgi:hypothetical protein
LKSTTTLTPFSPEQGAEYAGAAGRATPAAAATRAAATRRTSAFIG